MFKNILSTKGTRFATRGQRESSGGEQRACGYTMDAEQEVHGGEDQSGLWSYNYLMNER